MACDFLTDDCVNKIKQHAINEFPNECCGFVLKDDGYVLCQNQAESPQHSFEIGSTEYLKYSDHIKCVVHSHTNVKKEPSQLDMQMQIQTGVPWVLLTTNGHVADDPFIFGDMVVHDELIGMEFIHGAQDCYSLIRDWYAKNRGYLLEQYPRANDWWETAGGTDDDFYNTKFESCGFECVGQDINDLKEGDLCLMRVLGAKTINHGAVYLGDGLILHHLFGGLSKRELVNRWSKYIERILRYDDKSHAARKAKKALRQVIYV